jgi:hypothetical protein
MRRFANSIKVLMIGLSSMYLFQIAACRPAPFSLRGGGYSIIPNLSSTFSLNPLNLINQLTGLAT